MEYLIENGGKATLGALLRYTFPRGEEANSQIYDASNVKTVLTNCNYRMRTAKGFFVFKIERQDPISASAAVTFDPAIVSIQFQKRYMAQAVDGKLPLGFSIASGRIDPVYVAVDEVAPEHTVATPVPLKPRDPSGHYVAINDRPLKIYPKQFHILFCFAAAGSALTVRQIMTAKNSPAGDFDMSPSAWVGEINSLNQRAEREERRAWLQISKGGDSWVNRLYEPCAGVKLSSFSIDGKPVPVRDSTLEIAPDLTWAVAPR
jgi:hypothetical protein